MILYPENCIEVFDFEAIKSYLATLCRNESAKEIANRIMPLGDSNKAKVYLNQTNSFLEIIQNKFYFPSLLFQDVRKEIDYLYVNDAVLESKDFQNLYQLMETLNPVIRFLDEKKSLYPHLHQITAELIENKTINEEIEKIFDKLWMVKSNASKELADIRKRLQSKKQEADRIFRNNILKYKKLGWLLDFEESIYNGRRVLSVVAEHKNHIKGIIQGISDTGKSAFIEPIDTVEINNEVFELEELERREIYKILKQLTQTIRIYKSEIKAGFKALVWLDFTRAKAVLANKLKCILPEIINKPGVLIKKGYHPTLLLQNLEKQKPTIPIDLLLDEHQRIIIISGPNAGGKSIALKSLGLMLIMLRCGLLVPVAEGSRFYLYNKLLTDIGDAQSIEEGLSTYSSRLIKMKYILTVADKNALFLIDEFGTGSDPDMGGAIAEVILKELAQRRANGIVTTHFTNLKILAENAEGILNACMMYDQANLTPLYTLLIGQAGSSYTFEVAEKIGLPKPVLQRAKNIIDKGKLKFNNTITDLQFKKQSLENELKSLEEIQKEIAAKEKQLSVAKEKIENKYREINENRNEDLRLIEFGKKLQSILEDINLKKNDDEVLKRLKQMAGSYLLKKKKDQKITLKQNKKLENKKRAEMLERLKVGSKIKMFGSRSVGEVTDIIKEKIHVDFGGIIKTIITKDKIQTLIEKNQ